MTFTTPDLCDDHPDVRVLQLPLPLRSYGATEAFAGPVTTVTCFEDNSLVRDLVQTPGNGRVLVVDGGGSLRCALLGDMLAQNASDNGWAGLVINGCVRDVEILRSIDLGVMAIGSHPVRSVKKGVGEHDAPVTFGGVTLSRGDYLYADATGVIVADRQL